MVGRKPGRPSGKGKGAKPPSWVRFREDKSTKAGIDRTLNLDVSLSVSAPWSHDSLVRTIAHALKPPIPIESLSQELCQRIFQRGTTIFGRVGVHLGRIASNYPRMQWWISENGLNMEQLSPTLDSLRKFDRFAGPLVIAAMPKGRLSTDALREIAGQLDSEGFSMDKELERAQWKPIAAHNMKHSKHAIKTFQQACSNERFVRSIRLRLLRARKRVLAALAKS